MRLHYLQHIELEHPGSILEWATANGHTVTHTKFFNGEPLPALENFDWLVIMGGPMNIYEEESYPWLAQEKDLIRGAIAEGKTVLGLCLGAQLIADVIGGKVTKNGQPEIGWIPIWWSDKAQSDPLFSFFPQNSVVFEWHYDTFSVLPPEAEVLAESEACSHQAFVYKQRVFGFQFHLENTPQLLQGYIEESGNEMIPAAYVQSPEEVLSHPEYLAQNNAWMAEFLTRLAQTELAAKERKYITG
ncbi:type 1 glutamine amidotransferase [Paenibacillus sp. URB8-2]|uniref:type 1 glutamine amidotransferase n=1 Tax=Paenibacillus sp. URB8-2 TaxID=2741301 RepID=UPI0015BA8890|nr:type 1 glutamine amidotransferase [Paenibacillus sp. URB8-2]BCG58810.1 amidotransferase [Paenibacillus sp. URB8-2]